MAETREKIEFPTNIPKEVTLGKNFKNGSGEYGNWYGWNIFEGGQEKVLFAKDALHDKIKNYGEGSKLTITYAERKGADGKPFHEWQVSNGDGSPGRSAETPRGNVTPVYSKPVELDIERHLIRCAILTNKITEFLGIKEDAAVQACFATVAIDCQRHNIILDDPVPGDSSPSEPSKPQQDSGQRDALLKGIKSACKLLNDEGYEPRFTPKRLKEFVGEEFGCGLDELGVEAVEQLLKTLSDKLDNFRLNKTVGDEMLDPDDSTPF